MGNGIGLGGSRPAVSWDCEDATHQRGETHGLGRSGRRPGKIDEGCLTCRHGHGQRDPGTHSDTSEPGVLPGGFRELDRAPDCASGRTRIRDRAEVTYSESAGRGSSEAMPRLASSASWAAKRRRIWSSGFVRASHSRISDLSSISGRLPLGLGGVAKNVWQEFVAQSHRLQLRDGIVFRPLVDSATGDAKGFGERGDTTKCLGGLLSGDCGFVGHE